MTPWTPGVCVCVCRGSFSLSVYVCVCDAGVHFPCACIGKRFISSVELRVHSSAVG